jgi:hypothetical protein
MPAALTPIAWQSLGSTAATVTFSSIPGTYRDLRLVINGQATASSNMLVSFNGDTLSNNYFWVWMMGNGSIATSTSSNDRVFGNSQNAAGVMIYDFFDYSATDKHKTNLGRTSFSGIETIAVAERWASTAAITSIALTANGTTWAAGTTFGLYGVSA